MRKEFVPLTARVIRRKPWARGKKNRTERKNTNPTKVELENGIEHGTTEENGEGDEA